MTQVTQIDFPYLCHQNPSLSSYITNYLINLTQVTQINNLFIIKAKSVPRLTFHFLQREHSENLCHLCQVAPDTIIIVRDVTQISVSPTPDACRATRFMSLL